MSVVKFVSNARVPLDALPTLKRKGLDAAGVTVAGASAELTPVETGRLRSSISYRVINENNLHVGTNVEYGKFVHEDIYASHEMGQAKFISTAIDRETRTVQQHIQAALEGRL